MIVKYVTAYLNFDGNCRQAMQFYKKCLGTEIQISPYPDAKGQPTADRGARIMHSQLLRTGEPVLMPPAIPPRNPPRPGNNLSVSVEHDSVQEIEHLFGPVGNERQS